MLLFSSKRAVSAGTTLEWYLSRNLGLYSCASIRVYLWSSCVAARSRLGGGGEHCAALGDANLLAFSHLEPDPRRFPRLWVDRHHVARVDGLFFFENAARTLRRRTNVSLALVDTLDHHAVRVGIERLNLAGLAAVSSAHHDDLVTR